MPEAGEAQTPEAVLNTRENEAKPPKRGWGRGGGVEHQLTLPYPNVPSLALLS